MTEMQAIDKLGNASWKSEVKALKQLW